MNILQMSENHIGDDRQKPKNLNGITSLFQNDWIKHVIEARQ